MSLPLTMFTTVGPGYICIWMMSYSLLQLILNNVQFRLKLLT